MTGPLPKDPKTRQRRNRSSTAARFTDDGTARPVRTPALPKFRTWQPQTVGWWRDLWASPMRTEYLKVDVHGLLRLAVLIDRFWQGDASLAGEIRLQGQLFGLTPIDRRRLQWEVARGEEAERTRKPQPPSKPVADPRSLLSVVEGEEDKPRRRHRAAADA